MEPIRLLIVGASGLVGGNCLRYFTIMPGVVVKGSYFSYPTLDTSFYDTLNPDNPENFNVGAFNPTHILHAGALTHVDRCEEHPEESHLLTVESTRNIIKLAEKTNARLIYISTDYIFDGNEGPYLEDHEPNPLSIYGIHKLEAENMVRAREHSLILRVTNVYGVEERDKNFVARLLIACRNQETLHLKLPVDQYATPVNAWDVARALYLLLKDGKSGVYHIASTDYLNRVQLAQKVVSLFESNKITMEPVTTAELKQAASRPLQGGLKTQKFLSQYPTFDFGSVDSFLYNMVKPG